jgi:hypothetical protein
MSVDVMDTIQKLEFAFPKDFVENVYKLQQSRVNQQRTNRLGWQSPQYKDTSEIPWAKDIIRLISGGRPVDMFWFNISPPKAFHTWHAHGKEKLLQTGVFYLKTPLNCGNIEFRHQGDVFQIEPHSGLLLLFPPDLEHRVCENNSDEDRITLAFDIRK